MDPIQPGNPGINTQGGLTPTYEAGGYQSEERALAGFDPYQVGSGNPNTPGTTTTTPQGGPRPNFSGTAPVQPPAAPNAPTAPQPAVDRSGWPEWAQPRTPNGELPGPGQQQPQPPAQPGQQGQPQPSAAPTTPAAPEGYVSVDIPGIGQVHVTPEQAVHIGQFVADAQATHQETQLTNLKAEWTGYQEEEQRFYLDAGRAFNADLSPSAIDKWVADDLIDPSIAPLLKKAYTTANAAIHDAYQNAPSRVYELAELRHKVAEQDKQLSGMRTSTAKQGIAGIESSILQTPDLAGCDMVSVRREGERAIAEGKNAQEVTTIMQAEAKRTATRGSTVAKANHQIQVLQQARDGQGRFAPNNPQPAPVAVPPSNAALPPRTSGIPDPNLDPRGFELYLQAVQSNIGSSRQGT